MIMGELSCQFLSLTEIEINKPIMWKIMSSRWQTDNFNMLGSLLRKQKKEYDK